MRVATTLIIVATLLFVLLILRIALAMPFTKSNNVQTIKIVFDLFDLLINYYGVRHNLFSNHSFLIESFVRKYKFPTHFPYNKYRRFLIII